MNDNALTILDEKIWSHWGKSRPQETEWFKAAGRCDEKDDSTSQVEPFIWMNVSLIEKDAPIRSSKLSVEFTLGEYGEIVPPPLLSHLTPEDAIHRLYAAMALNGDPLDKPHSLAERQAILDRALQLAHGLRLCEVVAGISIENEVERGLYTAVQSGALLSLRPLGLETCEHPSFAPVIRFLGGKEWQVGLPEYGRVTILSAALVDVIEQAQVVYALWAADEGAERKGSRSG